jgi:two-component system sensor histidine kinase UhpB
MERLTGFKAPELVGRQAPYPWWLEPGRQTLQQFREALQQGFERQEKLFQKKSGERFWVEATVLPLQNHRYPGQYLITWMDITDSRQLRENTEYYSLRITQLQEAQNQRIARGLHEEIIQSLAALSLNLEGLNRTVLRQPEAVLSHLKEIQASVTAILERTRSFSYELRPGVLDYLGLVPALELLIEEVKSQGLEAELEVSGSVAKLNAETEITLFRIFQEALKNAREHAQASKVSLRVQFLSSKVRLSLWDNGRGFYVPKPLSNLVSSDKLGLASMEKRARIIGGTLKIHSKAKWGTQVMVEIPLEPKA